MMFKHVNNEGFQPINRGYSSVFHPNRLSLGVVVPLETYSKGPVPTMNRHVERVQLAEELGFSAIWLRDVPFNVPSFGDAGQMFDPFVYLGLLAAQTERIALVSPVLFYRYVIQRMLPRLLPASMCYRMGDSSWVLPLAIDQRSIQHSISPLTSVVQGFVQALTISNACGRTLWHSRTPLAVPMAAWICCPNLHPENCRCLLRELASKTPIGSRIMGMVG